MSLCTSCQGRVPASPDKVHNAEKDHFTSIFQLKRRACPRSFFPLERDGSIVVSGQHIDSPDDLAREAAYKIYYSRDGEQEHLLGEMLTARHHLAKLCGYETFGHRALTNSLAQTPEKTDLFLKGLADQLRSRVAGDHEQMQQIKKRINHKFDV